MNKFILTPKEIKTIDVELSNICNLKCPLCLPNISHKRDRFPAHFVDLELLKSKLSEFPNLDTISIAGDASEPSLYPHLFELISWIKEKFPSTFLAIHTNAKANDDSWWEELGKIVPKNSEVNFTICGLSQKMHEIYRVGSSLNDIFKHIKAFRKGNKNKNDFIQYIKFEYNKNYDKKEFSNLAKSFGGYNIIDTDPIYEHFNFKNYEFPKSGICSTKNFSLAFVNFLKNIKADPKKEIECYSYEKKVVRLDNFGKISPCVAYILFKDDDFLKNGILDYSEIYSGKFAEDICFSCEKRCRKFLWLFKRDAFYMCSRS